ncbi:MAG TPA: tyrosine--tRNA ligase, partial [Dehalococcoidales bacterium]|nr:tyrosine--tRNA ligase [Dehalococcoidales bacterium]
EVRWQSEWFDKFTLAEVIQLTSKFTVAQFLARDDFNARYNEGRPIAITEFLYPLLQAYDSVAIHADVEFGGTDQKFNFLVGRELQTMMGQPPQQCFMTPLLVGTEGSQKMSKSLGNYIGIAEPPDEIYGKAMSIRDDLILQYFELVTDVPDAELSEFRQALDNEAVNPMELKKRLAKELVTQLYDHKAATEAEEYFSRVVQKKEEPEERKEYRLSFRPFRYSTGEINVSRLLTATGLVAGTTECNRLINQGAVEMNGQKVTSYKYYIPDVINFRIGKRRFARVINTDSGE